MKITDKHVTDDDINSLIYWLETSRWVTPGLQRMAGNNVKALLELKQRRAIDRQREADACSG